MEHKRFINWLRVIEKYGAKHFHGMFPDRWWSPKWIKSTNKIGVTSLTLPIFVIVKAVCGRPLTQTWSTLQLPSLSLMMISVIRPPKFHPQSRNVLIKHFASHWSLTHNHFCRAMLCISAAYAIVRCLSVCVCVSVTLVDHVKTNKHIFEIFSPLGSHIILVFFIRVIIYTKRGGDIPTGTHPPLPLTGASNARGIGRNRNSEPISGFSACC